MKNVKAFLESEVIETYCLGLASPEQVASLFSYCDQYPEVKEQLELTQRAFTRAQQPSSYSKNIIRNSIIENKKLKKAKLSSGQLTEFIEISRHTNIERFKEVVEELKPPSDFENIHAISLFTDDTRELVLVWAKKMVPDEVHEKLDERFIVLEGTVDCYVEGEIFPMAAGDFMKIPPESNHKVVVTSGYAAKAIRSRVQIA